MQCEDHKQNELWLQKEHNISLVHAEKICFEGAMINSGSGIFNLSSSLLHV